MTFFAFAATAITKLTISVGSRSLGDKLKDVKTSRRMARLVEDAVDRIVEQVEGYLRAEKLNDRLQRILISSLCRNLQPLADDPQRFFAGDLNGAIIFKQCFPNGELPMEIRDEQLGQFFTVLFPQIAHFLAGSRFALEQWQAEGFREEFKRLSHLADEIRKMNAKVADLPETLVAAFANKVEQESETLLREFAQTLLNNLLLRLDLSPLRPERLLYGALGDHFVIPAFRERRKNAETLGLEPAILGALAIQGARHVVHGGAGVGKTTWSLWLQSRILQFDPGRLAVVLRLREVTKLEQQSLLDILRHQASPHLRDALTDSVLRTWHATGRLVVILDGFDEVPEERRDKVEKWAEELGLVAKKTAIIITSRPLQSGHLEGLSKPWQQWDLLPFDEHRIVEFIERWHRFLPEMELSPAERKVDATSLAETFFKDPSLKPLADTPLMLGTLLFVHHRDKKLPSGRVDLYERYIAAMLGLRDSGLGIQARATKLTDKEKRRVLAHIALHFHLNSVNEVNDDAMRLLVNEALSNFRFDEDAERLLHALQERTGLLQGPGAWSFMHKTIGEFLVAEMVCDGTIRFPNGHRLDRKELWSHRHNDAWIAVLCFWAGKTSPRELEEFVSDLLDENSYAASQLALSLLHDQGDRLSHDTQRGLGLRLLTIPVDSERNPESRGICTTVDVPDFARIEFECPISILRGLTVVHSSRALCEFFEREILVPSDINTCDESVRASFTVAAIWSIGRPDNHIIIDIARHFVHLPRRDLALYCFNSIKYHKVGNSITDWLEAFPEGRTWVPLLLAGLLAVVNRDQDPDQDPEATISRKVVGPLLWQWREDPVAEDWLTGSVSCSSWRDESRHDLIETTRQFLVLQGADEWGVSAAQHADLMAWCDRMASLRSELNLLKLDQI